MKVQEVGLSWNVSSPGGSHVPATVADQALEQLLRSPRWPEAMRRLQAAVRAEAKKRRYFYDVVTEQQKAEFISRITKRSSKARDLLLLSQKPCSCYTLRAM
jgi:hypothetical protein